METIEELERRAEIALQRLGVAEDLAWTIGILAAAVAYLKEGGWLIPLIAFAAGYYLATYPYRRKEAAASDAYEQAAGLGKYSKASPNN